MENLNAYNELNNWIEKNPNWDAGITLLNKYGKKQLVATVLSKGQFPANKKLMLSTIRNLRDEFKPKDITISKNLSTSQGDGSEATGGVVKTTEFDPENFDILKFDIEKADYYAKKAAFEHLELTAPSKGQKDITIALLAAQEAAKASDETKENEDPEPGDNPDSTKIVPLQGDERSGGGQTGPKDAKNHPVFSLKTMYPNLLLDTAPDSIKIMFADVIASWNKLCEAHDTELEAATTDEERAAVMAKIVAADETNRAAHAELKHYNDTQTVLGKHPKLLADKEEKELKELLDTKGALALNKKRDAAYNNFARYRKWCEEHPGDEKYAAKEKLRDKWANTLAICDKLLKSQEQ
ncbi:hypothetical protein [uncultured Draconibacterium sp.]|uniref:hypothetical protein n=1 Tax=uncultured Draconibacterium sp. TaxID=1573823 RepID=UPI0025D17F35|nr:hypothetical protein [uncultured Draconibacterium sp.]